ncbi:MAG: hypothetical protein ACK4LT_05965 [Aquificaceae bacterium]
MEKSSVLSALLIQDRIIRYNLKMLEMALKELRADVEELNFLAEACLSTEEELKSYNQVIQRVEKDLFSIIGEVIEYLYDLYEVFNFEITFLSNIPEELWREVERLDIPNSINSKIEDIASLLEDILQHERESPKLYAILTPFRAFLEVIRQALSFNKRLFESNFQKTV